MSFVYVSIGNSDDNLGQAEWFDFQQELQSLVEHYLAGGDLTMHGVWFSSPASPYQNMCVCVEVSDADIRTSLRRELGAMAGRYGQDGIAWAEAARTEMLSVKPLTVRSVPIGN